MSRASRGAASNAAAATATASKPAAAAGNGLTPVEVAEVAREVGANSGGGQSNDDRESSELL